MMSRPRRSARQAQRRPVCRVEALEQRQLLATGFFNGFTAGALAGFSLTALGNIGDTGTLQGADFAIGAPKADPVPLSGGLRQDAGEIYIIFGQPSLFNSGPIAAAGSDPGSLIRTLLDRREALVIQGASPNDQAGFSIAGVGNVIAGPRPDLLIGAPFAEDPASLPNDDRGRAYLVSGDAIFNEWQTQYQAFINNQSSRVPTIDLRELITNQQGLIYEGASAQDHAGWSVSGLQGAAQGVDRFLIGAPEADGPGQGSGDNRGAAYVIGSELGRLPEIVSLADVDSTGRGSILYGPSPGARLGAAVSGGGNAALGTSADLNNDLLPDFLLGAPNAIEHTQAVMIPLPPNPSRPGQVYLISGTQFTGANFAQYSLDVNADLLTLSAIIFEGAENGDQLGFSVAGAGDVDGDNRSDLIMGAPLRDLSGRPDTGEAYLVFGREVNGPIVNQRIDPVGNVTPINVATFTSAGSRVGITLQGGSAGDRAGYSVNTARNFSDPAGSTRAIEDFLVGAPFADGLSTQGLTLPDAGRAYLLFGNPGFVPGSVINLDLVAGGVGARFDGLNANDNLGFAVAPAGNIADSNLTFPLSLGPDILIGVPGFDTTNARIDAGQAQLMFGTTTTTGGTLPPPLPGTPQVGPGPIILTPGFQVFLPPGVPQGTPGVGHVPNPTRVLNVVNGIAVAAGPAPQTPAPRKRRRHHHKNQCTPVVESGGIAIVTQAVCGPQAKKNAPRPSITLVEDDILTVNDLLALLGLASR